MHTTPHRLARGTVTLNADHPIEHNLLGDVNGQEAVVEDWWDSPSVFGKSWMFADGNPTALIYAIRTAGLGLPIDDEVVYVKVDGLGMLLHESELP